MFIFLPTRINYTLHGCLSQQLFEINFSRLFNDSLSCFAQQINTIQTYPRFNNSKNYTIKRQSKSLQKKNRTFFLIEFNYKRIIQKKDTWNKTKTPIQTLFTNFIFVVHFKIFLLFFYNPCFFIPNTLHLPWGMKGWFLSSLIINVIIKVSP